MSRASQVVLLLVILLVWVGSFFLPAFNISGNEYRGYKIAAISAMLLFTIAKSELGVHLYFGSLWIANLFMAGSPIALFRVRRGKGLVFLSLMVFWDLLTLSFVPYDLTRPDRLASLRIAYWVWEGTLVAMTAILFWARATSRRQTLPR